MSHRLAIAALRSGMAPRVSAPRLAVEVAGIVFDNPLGLAAGFDKDAKCPDGALGLGFGHVEIGTVTPIAQPGNLRPRVFRLRADGGIINRYGFNNDGAERIGARLEARALRLGGRGGGARSRVTRRGVVGINIGANKTNESPIDDYRKAAAVLGPYADYITLNISSPNTPGLRSLQSPHWIEEVVGAARRGLGEAGCKPPVFVKLAPDLLPGELEAIAQTATQVGVAALVATNTTVGRPDDLVSRHRHETGGLSGAPLFWRSTRALATLASGLPANGPALIAAGGVARGWQAYAKILAGASLVQLYTALALDGPGLPLRIMRDLDRILRSDGHATVAQARGRELDARKAIDHAKGVAERIGARL